MGEAAEQIDPRILTDERAKELKQQYETPPDLFAWCNRAVMQFGIYGFGIDVAASPHNKKCELYICSPEEAEKCVDDPLCFGSNGLVQDWLPAVNPNTAAWCNPPFGMTKDFLPRAHREALIGKFSAVLTQTDPTPAWWQEAMIHATARIDIYPRVSFIQHPDYLAHMEATGKRPSGNPGGNTLWIYQPYDIDRPGGARVVRAGAWR